MLFHVQISSGKFITAFMFTYGYGILLAFSLNSEQMQTPRVLAVDNTSDSSDTGKMRKDILKGPSMQHKE